MIVITTSFQKQYNNVAFWLQLQRRFSSNITTLFFGCNYNVQNDVVLTSQLQRHFGNNITTLCRRLLIDVFFVTLLQRRDMVERRCDLKTTTLQRRHDFAFLLGNYKSRERYNTK